MAVGLNFRLLRKEGRRVGRPQAPGETQLGRHLLVGSVILTRLPVEQEGLLGRCRAHSALDAEHINNKHNDGQHVFTSRASY